MAKDTEDRFFNIVVISLLIISVILCCSEAMVRRRSNMVYRENKDQYEVFTESLLRGHVYLDHDVVDSRLLEMDNPYDFDERVNKHIHYRWDSAFYKGKFYMYFGIAPVFLTFLPYKIITGKTLISCLSTQCFVGFSIIGMFVFLYFLRSHFFKKTEFIVYLIAASIFSVVSIWYACVEPVLYCVPISAGICMAIWSLYFYFKAVYGEQSYNRSVVYALIGAIFGAITFACRPPVALVCFICIPLVIEFFKKYKFNKKTVASILLVLVPYVIVGCLLMYYNYVRFENPFEFGQSYQLTLTDQREILDLSNRLKSINLFKNIYTNFFGELRLNNKIPCINLTGAFFNFALFFLPYILFIWKKFRIFLREKKLYYVYITLLLLPFIIGTFDILASPILHERYHMDYYYLLSIATFIAISFICTYKPDDKKYTIRSNVAFSALLMMLGMKIMLLMLCIFLKSEVIIERLVE